MYVDSGISFNTGYGLSGALGYSWGNVRLEGELSYRKNNAKTLHENNISFRGRNYTRPGFDLTGHIRSLGFMANGYYDVDLYDNWITFAMAGVGGATIRADFRVMSEPPGVCFSTGSRARYGGSASCNILVFVIVGNELVKNFRRCRNKSCRVQSAW